MSPITFILFLRRPRDHTPHPTLRLSLPPPGNPRRSCLRRPSSVVSQTQLSLGALLRALGGKALHTVWCLKPNELKQPRVIEAALITHQIKYFGSVCKWQISPSGFEPSGCPNNTRKLLYKGWGWDLREGKREGFGSPLRLLICFVVIRLYFLVEVEAGCCGGR